MNDKPKSKWYWRLLRWGLVSLAMLATLAAILVTEEDWRGKHDWEAYQRAAEARGERLDMASVIPPAVPDDQNFFCAPIVAEALQADQYGTSNVVNRMDFKLDRGDSKFWPVTGAYWLRGQLTDLKPWQNYFRAFSETPEGKTNGFPVPATPGTPAADTLLGLGIFDPALEELRQASLRPEARLPLRYEDGFETSGELLPWLVTLKRCAILLQLHSLAELQNRQGGPALADVECLLRVSDSIHAQPSLILHLVHIATMSIGLQPIYEGLAQHCWSDAQLAELEHALAGEDFLAEGQFALKSEKIFAIDSLEKQRLTCEMKFTVEDGGKIVTTTNSLRRMPSAYFYQSELAFARLHEKFLEPLIDVTNRIISPSAFNQSQAEFNHLKKHFSPYAILAEMTIPDIHASVKKFATIQAGVDLARVACALERYRLARGEYPATLDPLTPQFIEALPHDIINGHPLHYRRTDDGRFVLYSVGWDEKDDGGAVFITTNHIVDRDRGDWVWQYPAGK